jgi:hypothetical protein
VTAYIFSTGYGQQTVWPRTYVGSRARDRGHAWHELAMANFDFVWEVLGALGFSQQDDSTPWRCLESTLQDRMVTAYIADNRGRGAVLEHLDETGVQIYTYPRKVPSDQLRDALLEDIDEEALTEVIAVLAARRQA